MAAEVHAEQQQVIWISVEAQTPYDIHDLPCQLRLMAIGQSPKKQGC
jgi:hypothetical protein